MLPSKPRHASSRRAHDLAVFSADVSFLERVESEEEDKTSMNENDGHTLNALPSDLADVEKSWNAIEFNIIDRKDCLLNVFSPKDFDEFIYLAEQAPSPVLSTLKFEPYSRVNASLDFVPPKMPPHLSLQGHQYLSSSYKISGVSGADYSFAPFRKNSPSNLLVHYYHPNFRWTGGAESQLGQRSNARICEITGDVNSLEPTSDIQYEVKLNRLDLVRTEPFFIELAIFDLTHMEKISESVFINPNSEELLLKSFSTNSVNLDSISRCGRVVFHISKTSESAFYLVCIIHKVYQAENRGIIDILPSSGGTNRPLTKDAIDTLANHANAALQMNSNFRQLLAWGFTPILDPDSKMLVQGELSFNDFLVRSRHGFSLDEETILSTIKEYNFSRTINKKWKSVTAFISLQANTTGILSGALIDCFFRKPICQFFLKSTHAEAKVVEDLDYIREVHQMEGVSQLNANSDFTNILYLYPSSINVGLDFKNIVVEVKVRATDEILHGEGLPIIFNPEFPNSFKTRAYTSISYDCRNPSFMDEIKIKLPTELHSQYHIFFTFYELDYQNSKDRKGENMRLIGYSLLPLYNDYRIVDSFYNLTIFNCLPSSAYLLNIIRLVKENVFDPTKYGFKVRCKVFSSLYSQDPFLNAFFRSQTGLLSSNSDISPFDLLECRLGQKIDKLKDSHSQKTREEMNSKILRTCYRSGMVLRRKVGKSSKYHDRWAVLSFNKFLFYRSWLDQIVEKEIDLAVGNATVAISNEKDHTGALILICEYDDNASVLCQPSLIKEASSVFIQRIH